MTDELMKDVFSCCRSSHQCKTCLQKRIEKKKLPEGTTPDDNWKDDAGERACQTWEWWCHRVCNSRDFVFFAEAICLVVLMQLSSCAVEQVFSQLKLMRDACGDNLKDDMLELQMFMCCNGELKCKVLEEEGE